MSNKKVVLEAITGLFIRRDASVLDTHFAPDYRQHNPTIGNGVAALRALAPKLSPNLRYEPGMIVEEGDIVMIHGRYVGWAEKPLVAVDIFRLPGIYGPGRSAIDQARAGTARRIDKPGQVFSRIHVEDIAGTVLMAITVAHAGAIYNVADDLPASTSDVVAFACDLLGKPAPTVIPWEQAEPTMSAMARSFYAETRRVRNDRIKNQLGVVLRYPTYREGLRAIAART